MNRAEREAKHRALHKDGRVVCGEYLIYLVGSRKPIVWVNRVPTAWSDTRVYDIYPRNGMPPLGYDRVARCKNFSEALLTVANLERRDHFRNVLGKLQVLFS